MTAELLTTGELAERLKVSGGTVRRWTRSGVIPEVHVSERVKRYDLEDVLKALKERRPDAAPC